MSRERKLGWLKSLGRLLLLLFTAAVTYVLVCVFNPQEEEPVETSPQELLSASPAVVLASENELLDIIADFPIPVLCSWGDASLRLIAGSSYDAAFENGFGRITALRYLYGTTEVDVFSIYPARAIPLLGRADYHMSAAPSPLLAGYNSVRMENETTIRIHIQTQSGLYAVMIPKTAVGVLSEIIRPLQLSTVSDL